MPLKAFRSTHTVSVLCQAHSKIALQMPRAMRKHYTEVLKILWGLPRKRPTPSVILLGMRWNSIHFASRRSPVSTDHFRSATPSFWRVFIGRLAPASSKPLSIHSPAKALANDSLSPLTLCALRALAVQLPCPQPKTSRCFQVPADNALLMMRDASTWPSPRMVLKWYFLILFGTYRYLLVHSGNLQNSRVPFSPAFSANGTFGTDFGLQNGTQLSIPIRVHYPFFIIPDRVGIRFSKPENFRKFFRKFPPTVHARAAPLTLSWPRPSIVAITPNFAFIPPHDESDC